MLGVWIIGNSNLDIVCYLERVIWNLSNILLEKEDQ